VHRERKPVASVDFRQFRYFIAVAEELHFGRAADRLHIAQSGLSQQILKLERSVRVKLLSRDRRSVQLTDAGRVFLDHARYAVELADRAMASPHLVERGKTGFLRVGTTILGMPPMAGRLLEAFENRFPDVEVELRPRLISELIDGISTFALDVAVVVFPFKSVDPPPRYQQLGTYELMAAVPEGHRFAKLKRIPRSELLTEPLIEGPRNINPDLFDHIHRIVFGDLEPPLRLEVADLEEARRLEHVAEGKGIGLTAAPSGMEHQPVPGVVFRPLDEGTPRLGYGLAWSATQTSPLLESFIETASDLAESEVPHDHTAATSRGA
jgi:DNA-binding transcriptional LysR family regulator